MQKIWMLALSFFTHLFVSVATFQARIIFQLTNINQNNSSNVYRLLDITLQLLSIGRNMQGTHFIPE